MPTVMIENIDFTMLLINEQLMQDIGTKIIILNIDSNNDDFNIDDIKY